MYMPYKQRGNVLNIVCMCVISTITMCMFTHKGLANTVKNGFGVFSNTAEICVDCKTSFLVILPAQNGIMDTWQFFIDTYSTPHSEGTLKDNATTLNFDYEFRDSGVFRPALMIRDSQGSITAHVTTEIKVKKGLLHEVISSNIAVGFAAVTAIVVFLAQNYLKRIFDNRKAYHVLVSKVCKEIDNIIESVNSSGPSRDAEWTTNPTDSNWDYRLNHEPFPSVLNEIADCKNRRQNEEIDSLQFIDQLRKIKQKLKFNKKYYFWFTFIAH